MLQKMNAFLRTPILFVFLLVCCCWMATATKTSSSECKKCKTYSLQTNSTQNSSEEDDGNRARRRRKRITGGLEGDIEQMPWLVFLSTSYQSRGQTQLFNCTGSLISARYVITNAHCLRVSSMLDNDTTTVVYGSANRVEGGHRIVVDKTALHVHPNYTAYFANGNGFSVHDLGIVDLGQEVEFDETVNSICTVCLEEATPTQGPAIIAGWGNYAGLCLGQTPEYPLVFRYDIVSMHACKTPDYTTNNMVCTYADLYKGIGGGDSGGPVLGSRHNNTENDDGRLYQLGVTGANNCRTTPMDQRENAFTKIDGEWMEQISGVKCKKNLDDN